jgi:outer membrane protein
MQFRKFSKIVISLGIVGGFLSATRVGAQDALPIMSLRECLEYTLKSNPSNVIYDNQIEMAERQRQEGLASYFPQINGTGTVDDNVKRQITVIPAGDFSPVDMKVRFGNRYITALTLQADQVIYDQAIIEGIRANKPNIQLALLKKRQNEDDLLYSTAASYYQVLIYKEQLNLIAENERKFSELMAVQKLQFEKGVITKVNFNRVKVNYNNILSQKKVAETNYSLAVNRLKNSMGVPIDQEIRVIDSINYTQEIALPVSEDFNIRNKPDYQILETNIRLQQIDLKRKRAAHFPTLSAYARYGANAFGNELIQSYEQFYDYSSIGVRLNVPIFSGFRRHSQIKQSELNLSNTQQSLILNSESIKLQLENANTQLLNSFNNLESNRDNMALAKEVFEDTNLQYQKGVVSLTDFLNADYAYKEAQSNYINSLLNYLLARIDLERSKGTIKQFANQL